MTSLAVSSASGPLVYGSASNGQLFAFSVDERQVVRHWDMRSMDTPLMGVPETYGVILDISEDRSTSPGWQSLTAAKWPRSIPRTSA